MVMRLFLFFLISNISIVFSQNIILDNGYLIQKLSQYDRNKDSILTENEIKKINKITFNGKHSLKISDLMKMKELTDLALYNVKNIGEVDLTQFKRLKKLIITNTERTTNDVSNLKILNYITVI